MIKATEERRAVVMVQRGKERTRVETRILVPHHDFVPTARVQGKYDPAQKQILIISRTVTEMRVTVPDSVGRRQPVVERPDARENRQARLRPADDRQRAAARRPVPVKRTGRVAHFIRRPLPMVAAPMGAIAVMF